MRRFPGRTRGIKSNKGWDCCLNVLEMVFFRVMGRMLVEPYRNNSRLYPPLKSAIAADLSAAPEETRLETLTNRSYSDGI